MSGAGLLVLGGLESGLKLLEPFIDVGLPLSELTEAAHDLARFALFLLLPG